MSKAQAPPSEGKAIALVLVAVFAFPAALWGFLSTASHMMFLDRLRREGRVVHGWITAKVAMTTPYTVWYNYWPECEFDKPYVPSGIQGVFQVWRYPRSPREDPLSFHARYEGYAIVSSQEYRLLRESEPVPITAVPGMPSLNTIGRVDRRRVWDVLSWHTNWKRYGLSGIALGVAAVVMACREWRRLRAAQPT